MKHVVVATIATVALCACATDERRDTGAPGMYGGPRLAKSAECAPPPKDLVVKDLEPGNGDAIAFRTAVLMSYTGWLYDGCKADFKGEQFDSSATHGKPLGFMVGAGKVIKGWDEGLIGMKEHGKRLLIIPADKAYGERAVGPIKPNSALVFEVQLERIIGHAPPQ